MVMVTDIHCHSYGCGNGCGYSSGFGYILIASVTGSVAGLGFDLIRVYVMVRVEESRLHSRMVTTKGSMNGCRTFVKLRVNF